MFFLRLVLKPLDYLFALGFTCEVIAEVITGLKREGSLVIQIDHEYSNWLFQVLILKLPHNLLLNAQHSLFSLTLSHQRQSINRFAIKHNPISLILLQLPSQILSPSAILQLWIHNFSQTIDSALYIISAITQASTISIYFLLFIVNGVSISEDTIQIIILTDIVLVLVIQWSCKFCYCCIQSPDCTSVSAWSIISVAIYYTSVISSHFFFTELNGIHSKGCHEGSFLYER